MAVYLSAPILAFVPRVLQEYNKFYRKVNSYECMPMSDRLETGRVGIGTRNYISSTTPKLT